METTPTKPRETKIIRLKRVAPPSDPAAPKSPSPYSPQLLQNTQAEAQLPVSRAKVVLDDYNSSSLPLPSTVAKPEANAIASVPMSVASPSTATSSTNQKRAKIASASNPEDEMLGAQKPPAKLEIAFTPTPDIIENGAIFSDVTTACDSLSISVIPLEADVILPTSQIKASTSSAHVASDEYTHFMQVSSSKSIPTVSISSLPINNQTIGCIYSDYSPDSGVSSEVEPIFETAERPDYLTVEPCRIQGYNLTLPVSFIGLSDYSSIFNFDVWRKALSEKERTFLQKLLPDGLNCDRIVSDLFSGRDIRFESPITRFTNDLKDGVFHQNVSKHFKRFESTERNVYLDKFGDYSDQNVLFSLEYAKKLQNPSELEGLDYYGRLVSQCDDAIEETQRLDDLKETPIHKKNIKSQMIQNMESRLNQSTEATKSIPFHKPIQCRYMNSSDDIEEETPRTTINPMSLCENHEDYVAGASQTKKASKMPSTANLRKAKLFNLLKDEALKKTSHNIRN